MDTQTLLNLPFDQYQRYQVIREIMTLYQQPGSETSLVDVGGFSRDHNSRDYLPARLFFPAQRVFTMDREYSREPSYIQADALSAPFRSESFDTAICSDVIEHIPADRRESFLSVLLDISRDVIIFTAPFHNPAVVQAENLLFEYIKKTLNTEHVQLLEHLELSLPRTEDVDRFLSSQGVSFFSFEAGYLHNWLMMMMVKHYLLSLGRPHDIQNMLDRYYNSHFYQIDFRSPGYRRFYVVVKNRNQRALLDRVKEWSDTLREKNSHLSLEKMNLAPLRVFMELDAMKREEFISQQAAQIEKFQELVNQQNRQLEERNRTIHTFSEQMLEQEKQIGLQARDIARSQGQITALELDISHKVEKISRNNAEIAEKREQINAMDRTITSQNQIIGEKESRIDELNQQIESIRRDIEALQLELEEKNRLIISQTLDLSEAGSLLSTRQKTIHERDSHIQNLEFALQRYRRLLPLRLIRGLYNLVSKQLLQGGAYYLSRMQARLRQIRHFGWYGLTDSGYSRWLKADKLQQSNENRAREELAGCTLQPKISVVIPVYNIDPAWVRKALDSLAGQWYDNWECCLIDDGSPGQNIRELLDEYQGKDPRFKVEAFPENRGIAAASNRGLAIADGEFVALMDHDDELSRDCFYRLVTFVNRFPQADVIYSDEDKLTLSGQRLKPVIKPDWSPAFFLTHNYLCHLVVIRRSIVNLVNGFRPGFEGSQDYDLLLRISEITGNIFHLPAICYHWRMMPGSAALTADAKPQAFEKSKIALREYMERKGRKVIVSDGFKRGLFRIKKIK